VGDGNTYAVILIKNGSLDSCFITGEKIKAQAKFYELLQDEGDSTSVDIEEGTAVISDDHKIFLASCDDLDV
jgi:hypothetical protein